MAKKAEATLLVKVVTKGKEAIKGLGDAFKKMGTAIVANARSIGIGLAAFAASITALAVKAGKFDQIKSSFEKLAASQGQNAEKILKKMKKLTDGMVSEMDLMVNANKAILLGLPLERFPEMLKIAKSASEATGESMQFMLQSIVLGIGRQSRLILDNLGIIVKVEDAYKKYARTLKKSVADLTENEKKQAFLNEALSVGVKNANKMTGSGDNVNKAWQRVKASFEDSSITLGRKLAPAIKAALDITTDFLAKSKEVHDTDYLTLFAAKSARIMVIMSTQLKMVANGFEILGNFFTSAKARITFNEADIKKSSKNLSRLLAEAIKIKRLQSKRLIEIDTNLAKESTGIITAEEKNKQKLLKAIRKETLIEEAKEKKRIREIETEKEVAKFKKNEKELNKWLAKEEIKENSRKARRKQKQEEKEKQETLAHAQDMADTIVEIMGGGLKSAAKIGVEAFTESFAPGFGKAAGEAFEILTQDSEEFLDTLTDLFSAKFLSNLIENMLVLAAMFADPTFWAEMVVTIIQSVIKGFTKAFASVGKINIFKRDPQRIKEIEKDIEQLNATILKKEQELQKLITKEVITENSRRLTEIEKQIKAAGDKRSELERQLNEQLKIRKNEHEEEMQKILEKRLAKDKTALEKTIDERKKLEKTLEDLKRQKEEGIKQGEIDALDEALKKEEAIVDFARSKKSALESQIATLQGELFFAEGSAAKAAIEENLASLQTELDLANEGLLEAQALFNTSDIEARKALGIEQVRTLDEQILAAETALVIAREAELLAQETHKNNKIQIEIDLGIEIEKLTTAGILRLEKEIRQAAIDEITLKETLKDKVLEIAVEKADGEIEEAKRARDAAEVELEKAKGKQTPLEQAGKAASGVEKGVREVFGLSDGGMVPGVQHFANGGTVDTVPAMLTPGEFVVNAESTKNNMGTLQSINEGGGGGSNVININFSGPVMGDEQQAREFALTIDNELLKLRQENESLSFDRAIF